MVTDLVLFVSEEVKQRNLSSNQRVKEEDDYKTNIFTIRFNLLCTLLLSTCHRFTKLPCTTWAELFEV